MINIQYPVFRRMVIGFLRDFADPEHVRGVWLNPAAAIAAGTVDSYDLAVTELYNEMAIYPNPSQTIGTVLVSEKEAASLRSFFDALDSFVELHPSVNLTEQMLATEAWQRVQQCARDFISSLEADEDGN